MSRTSGASGDGVGSGAGGASEIKEDLSSGAGSLSKKISFPHRQSELLDGIHLVPFRPGCASQSGDPRLGHGIVLVQECRLAVHTHSWRALGIMSRWAARRGKTHPHLRR